MMKHSPFETALQRSQSREMKREACLNAAVKLFNAYGFHAVSLDQVATSLGVSRPTIYHYLGNKDQVVLECVTRGMNMLSEAAEQAGRTPGDGLTKLSSFLILYAEITMMDFGRCVSRTSENVLSPENAAKLRSMKRRIDASIRAMIEAGMADGSIGKVDPKFAAFLLAGALNWPATWYRESGPLEATEVADRLVDILVRGLAPRLADQDRAREMARAG